MTDKPKQYRYKYNVELVKQEPSGVIIRTVRGSELAFIEQENFECDYEEVPEAFDRASSLLILDNKEQCFGGIDFVNSEGICKHRTVSGKVGWSPMETLLSNRSTAEESDDGWLPIESAPRDGCFLAYEEGDIYKCSFLYHDETGVAYSSHCGQPVVYTIHPTHWQHLPKPPASEV